MPSLLSPLVLAISPSDLDRSMLVRALVLGELTGVGAGVPCACCLQEGLIGLLAILRASSWKAMPGACSEYPFKSVQEMLRGCCACSGIFFGESGEIFAPPKGTGGGDNLAACTTGVATLTVLDAAAADAFAVSTEVCCCCMPTAVARSKFNNGTAIFTGPTGGVATFAAKWIPGLVLSLSIATGSGEAQLGAGSGDAHSAKLSHPKELFFGVFA